MYVATSLAPANPDAGETVAVAAGPPPASALDAIASQTNPAAKVKLGARGSIRRHAIKAA